MAAKESRLSKLHEMIAELFIDDINMCREEGIPMAASDKAVIVKFLKDNDITAVKDEDDMAKLEQEFSNLTDELAARRQSKKADLNLDKEDLAAFY